VYQGSYQLGVARLFLGLFTITAISLATLLPHNPLAPLLLGLGLWLRLGLYPFLEITQQSLWHDDERLVYIGVSLVVGLYLAFTIMANISSFVYGLAAIVMLLSGLLAWLTPALYNTVIPSPLHNLLAWFMVTESLLVLWLIPVNTGLALTFTFGLIFSFIALWVTPALGKLRLAHAGWAYLPAVLAILTLVGLPLTLGWTARLFVYESVFRIDNIFVLVLVVIAEILAFSSLAEYWLILSRGDEVVNYRRTAVGFIGAVPFLVPILGPTLVSSISDGIEVSPAFVSILINVVIVTGAVALAYSRADILSRLNIPTQFITEIAQLHWCLSWGESSLNYFSKGVLRLRITLEGQHYLAWAMFAALIGAIIILLN